MKEVQCLHHSLQNVLQTFCFGIPCQAKLEALVTLRQRSRQWRRNLQGYSWHTEEEMGTILKWSQSFGLLNNCNLVFLLKKITKNMCRINCSYMKSTSKPSKKSFLDPMIILAKDQLSSAFAPHTPKETKDD